MTATIIASSAVHRSTEAGAGAETGDPVAVVGAAGGASGATEDGRAEGADEGALRARPRIGAGVGVEGGVERKLTLYLMLQSVLLLAIASVLRMVKVRECSSIITCPCPLRTLSPFFLFELAIGAV